MDGKKVLCLVAAALLWQGSRSWAATIGCTAEVGEALAVSADQLDRTIVDPATGANIIVRVGEHDPLVVEFVTPQISIRKVFARGASTTTFASAGQRLVISVAGENVTIDVGGRTWQGSVRRPGALNEAGLLVRNSLVGWAAKQLLDRAALRPDTLEGNALLLTRALLGSLLGDPSPTHEYQRWARVRATQPRIAKAALADGPGECWDKYAAEAIRIANDYLECAGGCGWAGRFCMAGCGFLYDVRAEAAFMWFISCSGGFFVG